MIFLKMAWRNVLRRPSRTLITVSAIGFGLALFVFLWALADGFYAQLVDNSTGFYLGHIQVSARGFRVEYDPKLSLPQPERIADVLKSNNQVQSFSPRIETQAFLNSAAKSTGVLLTGIDPENEARVTVLSTAVKEGEYLGAEDGQSIILGKKLAEKLGVGVGEKLVVTVSAADGTLAQEAFRVKGILETGIESFDNYFAFVTLKGAQRILALENNVTSFVAALKDKTLADKTSQELKTALGQDRYDIQTWEEIMPILVQMIGLFNLVLNIILGIVFVVIAIGIANTIMMSVIERTREFGIVMAIGTKGSQVVRLIIFETVFLGLFGVLLGNAAGSLLISIFGKFGLNLSGLAPSLKTLPGAMAVIYPKIVLQHLVIPSLILFAVTVIIAFYPSMKAARLKPVEAIRFV